MTPAFKHRLLGTVILVLAGIIFLPDLLDGEKQLVKDDFKVIPERPEFQGVQQQQAIDQQQLEQARSEAKPAPVEETALDDDESAPGAVIASQTESEALPSQQYTEATVSGGAVSGNSEDTASGTADNAALNKAAWVVRVGSFSKVQNANALVAKLRQAGFTTFTRNITNSKGQQLTSVLVGPELRKKELEKQLPKLQKLTGIERLTVMSYQPAENN